MSEGHYCRIRAKAGAIASVVDLCRAGRKTYRHGITPSMSGAPARTQISALESNMKTNSSLSASEENTTGRVTPSVNGTANGAEG